MARREGGWRAAGILTVLVLGGCGPWITTIPTYWDPPPYAPRPRLALAEDPVPTVAIDTPDEPAPVPEPTPDVAAPVDDRPACTAIYVVTARRQLLAFDPRERAFELRGRLDCAGSGWATPFSMAVAQTGQAHVLYFDGRIYAVDVTDASCEETPFLPNQPPGYRLFGMGYAREGDGETLFVAQIPSWGRSHGLARVDVDTGKLTHIGGFSANPGHQIELTSTRDGLWGYVLNEPGTGGTLVEIDKDTAELKTMVPLPIGTRSSALAVAWWGGDFYIFTTFPGGTQVTRYDPDKGSSKVVATLDDVVVGAGVATCAPDRATP